MLTARSECHVSREAAVMRSGNGTLHGVGVHRLETRLSAVEKKSHAKKNKKE